MKRIIISICLFINATIAFSQEKIIFPDTFNYISECNIVGVAKNKILSCAEVDSFLVVSLSDTTGNILLTNSIPSIKTYGTIKTLSFHKKNRYIYYLTDTNPYFAQDSSETHLVITDTLLNVLFSKISTKARVKWCWLKSNLDTNFYLHETRFVKNWGDEQNITLFDIDGNEILKINSDSLQYQIPTYLVPVDSSEFTMITGWTNILQADLYNHASQKLNSNLCTLQEYYDSYLPSFYAMKNIEDTIYIVSNFYNTHSTFVGDHVFIKLDKKGNCLNYIIHQPKIKIDGFDYYMAPLSAAINDSLIIVYSKVAISILYGKYRYFVNIFDLDFNLICTHEVKKSELYEFFGNFYLVSDTTINNLKVLNSISCSILSSIEDNSVLNFATQIYPNPFANKFTIELNTLKSNTNLQLFDVLGNLVYQTGLDKQRTEINMPFLTNGIYIGVISDDKSKQTFKLAKE